MHDDRITDNMKNMMGIIDEYSRGLLQKLPSSELREYKEILSSYETPKVEASTVKRKRGDALIVINHLLLDRRSSFRKRLFTIITTIIMIVLAIASIAWAISEFVIYNPP